MTKSEFIMAYNIGHRDGKTGDYCPNDYEDMINTKPKQGEWIKDEITERSKGAYKYKCNICEAYHRARYDYCPSCGTRMAE